MRQVLTPRSDAPGRSGVAADFFSRSGHEVARDVIGCTVAHGDTAGVMEYFWDHAGALEAVGLSEQDAHADS